MLKLLLLAPVEWGRGGDYKGEREEVLCAKWARDWMSCISTRHDTLSRVWLLLLWLTASLLGYKCGLPCRRCATAQPQPDGPVRTQKDYDEEKLSRVPSLESRYYNERRRKRKRVDE